MENLAWWQQKKKNKFDHCVRYLISIKCRKWILKLYIIFTGKKNFLPPSHLMMGFSFLFKVFFSFFFFFSWFSLVLPKVPPMKRTVSVGRWVLCLETSGWTKSQSAGWRHGDTGELYKWAHIRRSGTTR